MRQRHHIALDSWRGIAAVMVVLHHFVTRSPLDGNPLIVHAWLCVDLFFVLSGFVIAASYREALAEGLGIGRFMLLRLGRVYPLHFVMLLAFIAAEAALALSGAPTARTGFFVNQTSPWAVLSNLLLIQGIGVHNALMTWNTVAWSVSTEVVAYIVFALLAVAMPRRLWLAMLVVCALSLVFLLPESIRPAGVRRFVELARCLAGFSVGVLLRYAYEWLAAPPRAERIERAGPALFSGLELAAVVLVVAFFVTVDSLPIHLLAPFVFAPLILVFAFDRGLLSRLLHKPFFVELGVLSYSIYMVHIFIQARVMQSIGILVGRLTGVKLVEFDPTHPLAAYVWGSGPVSGTLLLLVMLALVFFVSRWTYRVIEVPARQAVRRYVASLGPSPRQSPAGYQPPAAPPASMPPSAAST